MKKDYNNMIVMTNFQHLQFMGYQNLHDRFGFSTKRLKRFYESMQTEFDNWDKKVHDTEYYIKYSKEHGFDVYKWFRSVSMSIKMKIANVKPKRGLGTDIGKMIDASYMIYCMLSIYTLKEVFKFSKPQIDRFLDEMLYYVDSYARGYLNDELVNELMIEECKVDVINGIEFSTKSNSKGHIKEVV